MFTLETMAAPTVSSFTPLTPEPSLSPSTPASIVEPATVRVRCLLALWLKVIALLPPSTSEESNVALLLIATTAAISRGWRLGDASLEDQSWAFTGFDELDGGCFARGGQSAVQDCDRVALCLQCGSSPGAADLEMIVCGRAKLLLHCWACI